MACHGPIATIAALWIPPGTFDVHSLTAATLEPDPWRVLARFAATLLVAASAVGAKAQVDGDEPVPRLVIDGRLDEPAWSQARVFRDFVVTEPFTLAAPTLPTEVRLLSTPDGIAIGFDLPHPPDVPRVFERTGRDANQSGDRVNVYIDFDADGQVAYNFTVGLSGSIQDATWTNETSFSADWDGDWRHAVVADEDRWTVEILIPWSTATMRGSGADTRTIAVLFDRFLAANRERSASAPASFRRPRFVSDFERVEVRQHAAATLAAWPYATVLRDLIDARTETRVGLDLFWKPSGDFQLAAALNPDFGQVEADELIVNFDAIEAFQSDKRPFFTENQALFDLRTPDSGQLVYTRRIGGPRDDDPTRAADIGAALKLNGAWRGLAWGTLAAIESEHADDVGSAFLAQRLLKPGEILSVGWLGTWVDRPFLDRRSAVHAVDLTWRPAPTLDVAGQVISSRVDRDGLARQGQGAWVRAFYTPSTVWRHELEVTHFDARLDFNDIGFLRRASLNELEWTSWYTGSDFPEDHPLRQTEWRVEPQIRYNDRGARLPPMVFIDRRLSYRDGSQWSWQARIQGSGIDDLLTRGRGDVRLPPRHAFFAAWSAPRRGRFELELNGRTFEEGLSGWAAEIGTRGRWTVSDRLTVAGSLSAIESSDWLIWRGGDTLGQYARSQVRSRLELDWFPRDRHELRLKTQWVGLTARAPRAFRPAGDAAIVPSDVELSPFSLSNFGVQMRYRFEFRPGSDMYVVWSRGGEQFEDAEPGSLGDLWSAIPDLRDADQFLVKLRWRI
jgi:hypothetical protein